MNCCRLIVLYSFFFFVCLSTHGQSTHYQFSHLDISNGLSNNKANCFLKDTKGFLWIGTMAGLNRYDGYQFKVLRHDLRDTTTLSDDVITDIKEGPGGKLWIETRNGYNVYDPSAEKFERNANRALAKLGLPQTTITSIIKDKEGDYLFMMNKQAIYKYDVASRKTDLFYSASSAGHSMGAFAEDNKKQYWIIYQNGIIETINKETGKLTGRTNVAAQIFGKEIVFYSIFIDAENELWIYTPGNTKGGVIRYDPATGQYNYFEKDKGAVHLNNNIIISVQQDEKNNIWICTDHGGINVYNKKNNSIEYLLNNIEDDKSLSQNSIIAAYKDNTGIIWLGTFKKGVNYYHDNIIKFPVYRHQSSKPNSLSYDDVNRFVEDATGNIWIGTNGGGLIYFDRVNNKFTQYLHEPENINSISNNVIVSMCIDHDQNLWIGTYFGGLDCYKNGKFIHYRHNTADSNSLADDRVWEILEDSKRNLWVGTLNGGVDLFDRRKNIFYHYNTSQPNSIHSNYIADLLEDKEGKLWIATGNGIDVLDNTTGKVIQYVNYNNNPLGLSNNNIISLLEDSRGLIWVGTRDGLNVFNKQQKTFQSFRKENGLPDNTILNILEDNKHSLWISTTKGISNISVTTGKKEINPVEISCINYDELDGLQGTEFNENAALKTAKGEIIFGGAKGFNLFQPDQISGNKSMQNLVLTDLEVFNKPVGIGEMINDRVILPQSISNTQSIDLEHDENTLTIEFSALDFSNPRKIKYAYMLEGFNGEWIYTDGKMRKAVYTNLDPGNYTFRLKASAGDGKWAEKELQFKLKIFPPFWKTPLAFFIYLLVLVLALLFARKIIVDRAKMRFEVDHQRKEAERMEAVDAMKTKFFTNVSHEFRTPLSLILSPLDGIVKKATDPDQKKQLSLVQRNAKRLLNLVNQLLDFRRMEVQEFSLQLVKGDIVKFAKDITQSFSDISEKRDIELTFQSNVQDLQTFFDKDKLEKIFFNLLSNAFKYTPSSGKVNVELQFEEENNITIPGKAVTVIKISDNGIGIPAESQAKIFERYFQHDLPGNMHNYGTGIGLAITKEFVKLHNGTITVQSEPEKGTCFTIILPVITDEEVLNIDEGRDAVLVSEEETSLRIESSDDDNEAIPPDAKKSTVLLVEDNEDFRFYLKDNLKQRYNVIEAFNGKQGWEKVRELNPDLVVSDIMMPEMNGIELSKKIKADPGTSHIPVLLLTAMSSVEKELEGFNAGANDYITKPFTFEILASRIKNLLNLQEQMRKKFQKLLEVSPSEITVTPLDEDFMKRALEAVEKNIDRPEFSVEDLSSELFMSRMSLYRKLLSLTGKTPVEFIRIMRLKRAAQLLKTGSMNIAEVAYEVGFNNPKIFSKYFKEEFNVTPSQFQAQK